MEIRLLIIIHRLRRLIRLSIIIHNKIRSCRGTGQGSQPERSVDSYEVRHWMLVSGAGAVPQKIFPRFSFFVGAAIQTWCFWWKYLFYIVFTVGFCWLIPSRNLSVQCEHFFTIALTSRWVIFIFKDAVFKLKHGKLCHNQILRSVKWTINSGT